MSSSRIFLYELAFVDFSYCERQELKNIMVLVHFGAAALIHAKTPAAYPLSV